MRKITKLQARVWGFICGYFQRADKSPTMKEIQDGLSIRNIGTVQKALDGLEAKGYIIRKPKKHRSIHLLKEIPLPKEISNV